MIDIENMSIDEITSFAKDKFKVSIKVKSGPRGRPTKNIEGRIIGNWKIAKFHSRKGRTKYYKCVCVNCESSDIISDSLLREKRLKVCWECRKREWKEKGTRNNKILEARCEGCSLESIGNRFGITRERVRQICDRNNVKPSIDKREEIKKVALKFYNDGMNIYEIADHLVLNYTTVRKYLKEKGIVLEGRRKYRRSDLPNEEELMRMYRNGESIKNLSKKYKATYSTIRKRLERAGYKSPKRTKYIVEIDGEKMSIKAASVKYNKTFKTLKNRYNKGLKGRDLIDYKYGRVIDLKGKVFGNYKVLNLSHINKHKQSVWVCECSCGKVVKINGSSLRGRKCDRCISCSIQKRTKKYEYKGEEIGIRDISKKCKTSYDGVRYWLRKGKSVDWIIKRFKNKNRRKEIEWQQ